MKRQSGLSSVPRTKRRSYEGAKENGNPPGLTRVQMGARFVVDRNQCVLRWEDGPGENLAGPNGPSSGRRCYEVVRGTDAAGRPLCGPRCPGWRALREGRLVGRTRLVVAAGRSEPSWVTCNLTALPAPGGGALGHLSGDVRSADHASPPSERGASSLLDDLAAVGALAASLDHLSLPNDLEHSLGFVRDACRADAAEIFLTEPDGRSVALTSYCGPFRRAFFEISRFNRGQGYPGLVIARGEPIVTRDLAHDGRYLRTAVKERGFHGYVCVPFQGAGAALGSLHAAFRAEDADLARALGVLKWASKPIGAALGSALLELGASARRSVDQTRTCAEQSFPALVADVLGHLVVFSGATGGTLTLFGSNRQQASLHVKHGMVPVGTCSALERQSGGGCPAVNEQRVVVRAGPRATWPVQCQGSRLGGAACYCLPLVSDGGPFGMARVYFPKLHKRTPTWGLLAAELAAREGHEVIRAAWHEAERRRSMRAWGESSPRTVPATLHGTSGAAFPMHSPSRQTERTPVARLDVRCLGPFDLWLDGAPVDASLLRRKKSLTLLKLLLTQQGRPVPTDRLIEALWPDSDPTRRSSQLYVLVHELRALLQPSGRLSDSTFIQNDNSHYRFNFDGSCTVDAVDFQSLIARARRSGEIRDDVTTIEAYEAAVALYRGDYMEDEPYAEWCWQEREHFREVCLDALLRLGTLLGASGNWARSVSHLQHALRIDRFREEVHRDLMFSLWAGGWRDQAVRQYETCRRLLSEELNVAPTPETQRLLQRIRNSPRP